MSENLLSKAVVIRDEKTQNANTATRIGQLFIDVINYMGKSLNAEAVTFDSSAASVYMVFASKEGNITIQLPIVTEERAGFITPALLNQILEYSTDLVKTEKTRAENKEKEMSDMIDANNKGLSAIRSESTLGTEGNGNNLTLVMNIGKGGRVSVDLPVHGGSDGYTPAENPALIAPSLFEELIELFNSVEETQEIDDAQNNILKDIDVKLYPLEASMTIKNSNGSSGLLFKKGTEQELTISIQTKRNGIVVTPLYVTDGNNEDVEYPLTERVTENKTYTAKVYYEHQLMKGVKNLLMVTVSKTVKFVAAIKFGMWPSEKMTVNEFVGLTEERIAESVNGNYTITSEYSGFIWICSPVGGINKITMNGFDVPMENVSVLSVNGDSYKCYRSSSEMMAGTYTLIVS